MSEKNKRDSNPMLDLFCVEAQSQLSVLRESLAALHSDPEDKNELKSSNIAITSLKGAAKIASISQVFELARIMETIISSVLQGKAGLNEGIISILETAIEPVAELISAAEQDVDAWLKKNNDLFTDLCVNLSALQDDQLAIDTDDLKQSQQASQNRPDTDKTTNRNNNQQSRDSVADLSMLELFQMEVESQTQKLSENLIQLESSPDNPELLEELMRAAHSVKGAARMVGLEDSVRVSHMMEDVFVAAQNGKFILEPGDIDIILVCVDILAAMAKATIENYDEWLSAHSTEIDESLTALSAILAQTPRNRPSARNTNAVSDNKPAENSLDIESKSAEIKSVDNVVRVSAESLNRLQGLAGEALVESRWLAPYSDSLLRIKKRQAELVTLLDQMREQLFDIKANEILTETMHNAHARANECRELLTSSLAELESYDRRSNSLSHRLHREVLQARMRPFSDGVQGFQRLVRELSRSLNKDIQLDIRGMDTQVDRDILDKLQAPLNHMIRNAIDHGIEEPDERVTRGKPARGTIRLEAMHTAGMLSISVQDDGRGIDLDNLRRKIIARNMVTQEMADNLSESELLDFMFLPNFSTRDDVSEISGRGVGLDVVHSVVQELRGQIRSATEPGAGTKFQFQLPLTLSVIRALVVEIANEPYAYPLARIDQTLKINKASIETMEGRQYFTFGNQHIGLITAHQILGKQSQPVFDEEIPVVVVSDRVNKYGIVVDEFLGERNLVVHTIDPRLGKIQDISSASLTENGEPLLIFDVDDLFRSIDIILSGGRLDRLASQQQEKISAKSSKRVLVVDDSITVREVERNLLQSKGYSVEVAVDGMDGWNAARTSQYDLIVSDIDMPRMNGFDFVSMLKGDDRLREVPVIIVSYKDREEDRQRGLEVGADYYLTKGSFHDDSLVDAVMDLIGEP
jgi:two-component system sensor histidine kinase and response regulator WspE